MTRFPKILLPIDLEEPSLAAVHQAGALAHHFHSQVLLLHVVPPLSYLSIHEGRHGELLRERVLEAEKKIDATLQRDLKGISCERMVYKGDPAEVLATVAREQNVSLVVMATHATSGMAGRLMGSVTAKALSTVECPIWTGPPNGVSPDLKIQSVLCALDFGARDRERVGWAKSVADEFHARLTLAHVAPSVEIYGPGGTHEIPSMKADLLDAAKRTTAKLQEETGTTAGMYLGYGDVPKGLTEAAKQTNADLLVIGRRARTGWLGGHAYSIISQAQIPVLSV